MRADVVLLDYIITLVDNWHLRTASSGAAYANWIKKETYRPWLVKLLKGYKVVLVTARRDQYRGVTLARIKEAAPDLVLTDAFFNTHNEMAHKSKERVLHEYIFPKYGPAWNTNYLALECNKITRKMYSRYKIKAVDVRDGGETWTKLPRV